MSQTNEEKFEAFTRELAVVLNKHNVDTEMQVPDFILATYVVNSMLNLRHAMLMLKAFYETPAEPPPTKEDIN